LSPEANTRPGQSRKRNAGTVRATVVWSTLSIATASPCSRTYATSVCWYTYINRRQQSGRRCKNPRLLNYRFPGGGYYGLGGWWRGGLDGLRQENRNNNVTLLLSSPTSSFCLSVNMFKEDVDWSTHKRGPCYKPAAVTYDIFFLFSYSFLSRT